MQNRVVVSIAGQNYTLVATEDEGYIENVAAHVNKRVQEVVDGAKASLVDGAILGALNIADEYFKEMQTTEKLRGQLKEYLEETNQAKLELSEAKREIFKLEQQARR